MKKVVILFLGMGMMFACTNVKESKEYKELEAERDSLLQLSSSANEEVAEMMSVISEVEENFNKIREAEKYLFTQSSESGEMSQDSQNNNRNFPTI
jgi:predicted  nucleic acid-binding Zn-ribbon protein